MGELTRIARVVRPGTADVSRVTDLAIVGDWLYATTRHDGQIDSWAIGGGGLTLHDTVDHKGVLRAGDLGALTLLDLASGPALVTGGGAGGALVLRKLGSDGTLPGGKTLSDTTGDLGTLQHATVVTLPNGSLAVYGSQAGRDGLAQIVFGDAGGITSQKTVNDTTRTYAADIAATASAQVDGTTYIYTASATENGITSWSVANNGNLHAVSHMGNPDGLWIATPTAMASVTLNGRTFLVLASAGTDSLSVLSTQADGSLTIVDHLLDTRDTRFGSVAALDVITWRGQAFVVAGGGDDGITLLQLLPDGQLVVRATMVDTRALSLDNVAAIAATGSGNGLDIFVAAASENGLTRLRYDLGPQGQTLKAGTAGGTLTGGNGADILTGRGGDDTLNGGKGDDILRDGAGSDVLTGGAGADIFVMTFDGARDTITDFTLGEDRIDLSAWPMVRSKTQLTLAMTKTGFTITYGDDVLVVTSADGKTIDHRLLADADLIGGARIPQVIIPGYPGPILSIPDLPGQQNASPSSGGAPGSGGGGLRPPPDTGLTVISGISFLKHKMKKITGVKLEGTDQRDLLVGRKTNDKLDGARGADTLKGRGGTDKLYGRAGKDTLAGAAGDDRLVGGGGADRLKGGSGQDRLIGGTGKDRIAGNGGDDRLFGGKGNDKLGGGGGNDLLYGHKGRDRLSGGTGDDRLAGAAKGDRLLGGAGHDVLLGGAGNDKLFGGRGHDRLSGGSGSDILTGGADNDTLYGNAGHDVMAGEAGNDTLYGGSGNDKLYGGDGNDLMDGGTGTDTLYGGIGNDRVLGGDDNDLLLGDLGNDWLDGGGGNDRLAGGDGHDVLIGGIGNDIASGEGGNDLMDGGAGNDALYGGDGNDTLRGQDGNDLLRGGVGNDIIDGHAGQDRIYGDAGNDRLNGQDGHDLIDAGSGNDTLTGGTGNDTLLGGSGRDRIFGQDGNDQIDGGSDHDTLDGGTGNDVITGAAGNDTLFGHDGNDALAGGGNHDRMLGGAGNDRLFGGDGQDSLWGGTGADSLWGDTGHDDLRGEAGNDRLYGGDGNDTLSGGDGSDILTGGAGADRFVFATGRATITDMTLGTDRLQLETDLWGGGLIQGDVVFVYASVQGGNTVFDFGDDHILQLTGVTDIDALAGSITFI